MNIKLLHITLILSLCAALAACSDQDVWVDENSEGKTPIELSVGGVDAPAVTRAVITDGTDKTLNTFDVDTKIFMVMKSEYGTTDFDDPDDPHVAKYTVARGDVLVSENDNTNNRSIVKFDATNQRYWDDAHARSSQLDVWAYAQKGMGWTQCTFEVPNSGSGIDAYKDKPYNTAEVPSPIWSKGTAGEIYPAIRRWKASHHDSHAQSQQSVMCQDLLFSNNLTNNTSGDNRLKYNFGTRKFPQVGEAHMIFYHAMSKITIHIKKGEGFKNTDPFAFSTGNVKLMGFNTEGLFNIKTGQFEYIHPESGYDIPEIYKWTTPAAGDTYTLEALVIPNVDGNVLGLADANSRWNDDNTTKSMEFIIDHNKYEISQDQLYDALKANPANTSIVAGSKVDLEAGKNYVFTFTVGKQKINNITAQVAPWENVDAENITPTNARIKLQLEERGDAQTSDVAFYKAEDNNPGTIDDDYTTWNWKTGYTNLNATYSSTHWTTNFFWESNKDFYHFRALMPAATGVTTDGSGDGDYATLTSAASYTDVRWGAPMLDDGDNETAGTFKWNYGPTTYGFDGLDGKAANDHQIYKAIGPTEDPVKLVLFHMMSDLTFTIKTTTEADAVDLGNGSSSKTVVELVDYKTGGKVLLGNGLVQATGDATTAEISQNAFTAGTVSPAASAIAKYVYGAVPQDLTNVKLRITTPDNNQYIVDLGGVKATTVNTNNIANPYTQGSDSKYTINRWYPGFKYNYSFTLKKTGITNLTATIVNWETVTADDETVQIK